MPSLSQLLAAHGRLLWLDAASSRVQVGVVEAKGNGRWASSDDEAGVALFRCLDQLGVDPGSIPAFVFCEGPGSILGVRTSAMAIRTWLALQPRPVFAYASLALAAPGTGNPSAVVIADARRASWHRYRRADGLSRVEGTALAGTGPLLTPAGFRHWSPLPPGTSEIPYDLPTLAAAALAADADLFRPTAEPDAFLHEEPSYVQWSQQIHRAPAPSP